MLYEPYHRAPKRREKKEVIQRGEHSPKKREFRANDSHDVSRLFSVIPKLNVHSLDENYSGDEFNQRHNQSHHNKHQDVIFHASTATADDVRVHKTQAEKRDRSESINRKARTCQKSRIEPQAVGVRFVEKSAKEQFYYPAQNSAKEKEKRHHDKSMKRI